MRIRRTRLTKDFLQVPNGTVRDGRLSHMARGILVELLSRPDGWEATADGMWRASTAIHGKASPGRRAFRAAFAELKEHGYLTAGREAIGSGKHATILTLTDVPHAGTSVRPGTSHNTAGGTGVPHAGTPEGQTGVPPAGTPERPAQTSLFAGGTDVPLSDVPHAGTSNTENGLRNTGRNTSPSTALSVPANGAYPQANSNEQRPAWLDQLQDAMSLAGINLPWKFRGDDLIRIHNDIQRLGIPLMVEDALKAVEGSSKPIFSSRFFYDRWHAIRTPASIGDGDAANVVALRKPPASRQQQETDDLFDRAMQRAQARMQQESS